MGFSQKLEELFEPSSIAFHYQKYYLSYDSLKQEIIKIAEKAEKLGPPEQRAEDLSAAQKGGWMPEEEFQVELDKINLFALVKREDIYRSLQTIAEQCNQASVSYLPSLEKALEEQALEIQHLDQFIRLNYQGLSNLVKKFDALIKISGSSFFVARLVKQPFCNIPLEDVLILYSLCWTRFRNSQALSSEQSKDATWKPPESFVRSTAKYWVKPEKVCQLKTTILRHLPYLIFGASLKDQEKFLDPLHVQEDFGEETRGKQGDMEETQLLSSIYFDSLDASSYKERIHRHEGARLVRFRWYGENSGDPSKEIFVERKVHHEAWTSEKSAKERFSLPQRLVFDFMKGTLDVDKYFDDLIERKPGKKKSLEYQRGLAHEVQEMLVSRGMQPMIRTSYYRSAFQLATDNKVRISLDSQMCLLKECMADGHPSRPWCRLASDVLAEGDMQSFKYGILEVKLQDASNPPQWVSDLLRDCEAIQVHKFSKFQHAMAFLYPEKVEILPHWVDDYVGEIEEDRRQREAVDDFMSPPREGQRDGRTSKRSGHEVKDMHCVEPKSVFANERTFLHYTQKGVYISGIGVSFFAFKRPLFYFLSSLLGLVNICFLLWAYYEYKKRQSLISQKMAIDKSKERLDSRFGPTVVTSIILAILGVNTLTQMHIL